MCDDKRPPIDPKYILNKKYIINIQNNHQLILNKKRNNEVELNNDREIKRKIIDVVN